MTTNLREWAKFSIPPPLWIKVAGGALLILAIFGVTTTVLANNDTNGDHKGRLITFYDEGTEKTILSGAKTVAEALTQAKIEVEDVDAVEPTRDTELYASSYNVNIYRARPVVVKDGTTQIRVVTAAQTGRTMAIAAGVELYPEDIAEVKNATDILKNGGAGQYVEIRRAFEIDLVLYGQERRVRTQAETVEDFIKEKNLNVSPSDTMNLGLSSKLRYGMTLKIWREGKNIVTIDEEIPFGTDAIQDTDREIGYKEIKTPGRNGKRTTTYEVEMHGGVETSARMEINSLVLLEPVNQVEVVGTKVPFANVNLSANKVSIMTAAGVPASDQGYAAFIIDHENGMWCPIRWQGWGCLDNYVEKFPGAENSAGVGYGLCQSTPGAKMASAGSDWRTNAVTQMKWCQSYALGRYGSWQAAYNFKVSRGWW